MRTSSQLTKVDQCEKHPRINITQTTDYISRAAAQKEVILRILRGEPIADIRGEIDSILVSRNCHFENREQKMANLALYEARINRFLDWETTRPHIYPEGLDLTVNFFGEDIIANPDYFVVNERANTVTVVKLSTSRVKNEEDVLEQYETYALGLVGEKLFPEKTVVVQYAYLGDKDSRTEREAINYPYDSVDYKKTIGTVFAERVKNFFEKKYKKEMNNPTTCSPEECASCSMYNVCHYEEAPISVDVMKEVKPISEIRLTYAQKQVIDYEKGVARINAGAGAGKTLVVAMRIVELLRKGYEPEDICLLTFTKAGAEEMTARVVQYCAGYGLLIDPSRIVSTTFNAFCHNIIKEHFDKLGYTAPPRVIPDETKSGIINRILDVYPRLEEWNYTSVSSGPYARFTKSALSTAKNLFTEIKKEGYTRLNNPYESSYSPESLDVIFRMYNEYNDILHMRNYVEYDDQILQVFKLLEIYPQLFEEIGFRHIVVDEFQDTDLPQINLLNKIMDNSKFLSFMAVGDDSQSIFAFRHTSPEYMINFGTYFGHFDDFNLVENHRSLGDIIQFANKVNALNTNRVEKDLIATKPNGIGPQIHGFYSQKNEYEWIANQIKEQIEAGRTPSDIAFLASDRNELTKMASILTSMGIPSILMNPIPYVANSRVAAICTFYDSFMEGSTRGFLDYKNVLMQGGLINLEASELEQIVEEFTTELYSEEKTLARFVEFAKKLDENEMDECYQSFLEKISFCQSLDELSEFFRDFSLYGAQSMFKREGKYEGVCLTTVHSAKGLEWDVTYLSLSHFDNERNHRFASRNTNTPEKEEINRKWFVGATRAREQLIMTGEYVLKFTQKELLLNEYVRKAYEMLGKTYGYVSGVYWETKEREKREALEQKTKTKIDPQKPEIKPEIPTSKKSSKSPGDLIATYRSAPKKEVEDLSADEIEFA